MNAISNKFLLAGDKFILEIHLRQPGSTHNACEILTKNKNTIQKVKKKKEDSEYISQN